MIISRVKITKLFLSCRFLFVSFFCWLSMSSVSFVFAQTDNVNADLDQSISRGNNANSSERPLVIKPTNKEKTDSDQEKIGREALQRGEIDKAENIFNEMCEKEGINGLKGHRSVGGYRASMYNAMSIDSVQVLVDVMNELEKKA